MKPIEKAVIAIALSVMTILTFLGFRENKMLQLNEYRVHGADIPESFSGFRIAHVSDLHNTQFGEGNRELLSLLAQADPDLIAITGDLVDSRRPDETAAVFFVEQAAKIAPVYYVAGNHESRRPYSGVREKLIAAGAIVLDNESRILEKDGQSVTIIGLMDPDFSDKSAFLAAMKELTEGISGYSVLLCHRPEYFEEYAASGISLALCGHVHGGQFRLPGVGGIFAPDQGFFPQYDAGLFTSGNATMFVSRGLGNSSFPFRLGNPPELVVLELWADE